MRKLLVIALLPCVKLYTSVLDILAGYWSLRRSNNILIVLGRPKKRAGQTMEHKVWLAILNATWFSHHNLTSDLVCPVFMTHSNFPPPFVSGSSGHNE